MSALPHMLTERLLPVGHWIEFCHLSALTFVLFSNPENRYFHPVKLFPVAEQRL